MAYELKGTTNLGQLRALAQRIKGEDYASKKFVAEQIAAADHLSRKKVDSLDGIDLTAPDAGKYIYMVPNADAEDGNLYDEYQVIDGKLEFMGNTAVDLSGYQQKEAGKGLSTNDFTDEDKEKLDGLNIATDEEVQEMLNEVFGAAQAEGE